MSATGLDRDDLLVPATRYYMGRMTIAATAHCVALAEAWPTLPERIREAIRTDLEDAFRRDDQVRAGERRDFYPLGADMDREAWVLVRRAWLATDKAKAKNAGTSEDIEEGGEET